MYEYLKMQDRDFLATVDEQLQISAFEIKQMEGTANFICYELGHSANPEITQRLYNIRGGKDEGMAEEDLVEIPPLS